MRANRVIRIGSITAATVGIIGVAVWLVIDAFRWNPETTVVTPPFSANGGIVRRTLPPVGIQVSLIPQLCPGMSRTEVEELLGYPAADAVRPVCESGGRPTYHTTYPLDFGNEVGGGGATRPVPGAGPRTLVGLEFDATLPGHPLINVFYPDPLF